MNIIHTSENNIHLLQSLQSLQPDKAIANRQICSLSQSESHVGRKVGVLEISSVLRSGSENHDSGRVAVVQTQLRQTVPNGPKEK